MSEITKSDIEKTLFELKAAAAVFLQSYDHATLALDESAWQDENSLDADIEPRASFSSDDLTIVARQARALVGTLEGLV